MADYKKISEDTVSMTYSINRTVDLAAYKKELGDIEKRLVELPKQKTGPDRETLDFWNEMNVFIDEENWMLKRKAYIGNLFQEIAEANEMPDKYLEPIKEPIKK